MEGTHPESPPFVLDVRWMASHMPPVTVFRYLLERSHSCAPLTAAVSSRKPNATQTNTVINTRFATGTLWPRNRGRKFALTHAVDTPKPGQWRPPIFSRSAEPSKHFLYVLGFLIKEKRTR